jgi:hypothetical protein
LDHAEAKVFRDRAVSEDEATRADANSEDEGFDANHGE